MEVSNINNITANIPSYKEKVYLKVSEITFKVRDGNHKKSIKKRVIKTIRSSPRCIGRTRTNYKLENIKKNLTLKLKRKDNVSYA